MHLFSFGGSTDLLSVNVFSELVNELDFMLFMEFFIINELSRSRLAKLLSGDRE